MKRFALWAVLMLCAGTAAAQTVGTWGQANRQPSNATAPSVPTIKVMVIGGVNGTDTTFVPLQFDANGYAKLTDPSRDRDNWKLYPNIINNRLGASTATGNTMVDSCQAQDTHDMKRLWLVLYGQPDSVSTVVRLAAEIRGHYNTATDSGSCYPWRRWPVRAAGGPLSGVTVASISTAAAGTVLHAAAAAGSIGIFSPIAPGWLVVGPGVAQGTTVVSKGTSDSACTITPAVSQPVNAQTMTFYAPSAAATVSADVDSVGDFTSGQTAVAQTTSQTAPLWSGEFIVRFDVARNDLTGAGAGGFGSYPKGMWIPLYDGNGIPFGAPYTSVRIRVLSGVKVGFRIRADLVGSSL